MRCSDGAAVRAVFDRGLADARISQAIALGIDYTIDLATNQARLPQLAVLHLRDAYPETDIRALISEWVTAFR